jgi:hypothetical protein
MYKYRISVIGGNVTYLCNDYTSYHDVIKIADPVIDLPEYFEAKYKPVSVVIPVNAALIEILK